MSQATQTDEERIEFEQDGVQVEKTISEAEDGVTGVRYELSVTGVESVEVRLTEEIPDAFSDGEIGLPPKHRDDWTITEDRRHVFERTIEPGDPHATLYGVKSTDPAVVEGFTGRPQMEVVAATRGGPSDEELHATFADAEDEGGDDDEPSEEISLEKPDAEDESVASAATESEGSEVDEGVADGPPGDDAARNGAGVKASANDESAAEGHTESGQTGDGDAENDAIDEASDASETTVPDIGTASDESNRLATSAERPDEAPRAGTDGGRGVAGARGKSAEVSQSDTRPVESLASAIEAGDYNEEALDTLRDALVDEDSNSTSVRIRHLRDRMDDLAAYSDALEEFIDENGTARQVLEEVQAETAALQKSVDELRETVEEVPELREDLEHVSDRFDEVRTSVSTLEETVEIERAWLEEVGQTFADRPTTDGE